MKVALKTNRFKIVVSLTSVNMYQAGCLHLNEGMALDHTFLYIGSLSGLSADPKDTYGCPLYSSWINQNDSDENTHTFVIPY